MIVQQYGLIYRRVSFQDIETLRYWRNQSFIRDTMQFKDYITPSMQLIWFNHINNAFNYYFIIEHHGEKIGLINCKDVESKTNIAEGGIFIWKKEYWGTMIPALASLTMLQAVFEIFKSGDVSIATVSVENKKALDFNLKLGYEIKETTSDGKWYKLFLSKERYYNYSLKLINAAKIYHQEESIFKLSGTPNSNQAQQINQYLLLNPNH